MSLGNTHAHTIVSFPVQFLLLAEGLGTRLAHTIANGFGRVLAYWAPPRLLSHIGRVSSLFHTVVHSIRKKAELGEEPRGGGGDLGRGGPGSETT